MSPATRQHTPGPWQALLSGCTRAIATANGAPKQATICRLFTECASFGAGEPEANARLIAAAPDLLAALEAAAELAEGTVKLLRALDMESGRIAAECVLRDARAAIAKATGGAA